MEQPLLLPVQDDIVGDGGDKMPAKAHRKRIATFAFGALFCAAVLSTAALLCVRSSFALRAIVSRHSYTASFACRNLPWRAASACQRMVDRWALDTFYFDPGYSWQYDDEVYDSKRGGWPFHPPAGWSKIALRALGKYTSDDWLNVDEGWAIAYHGTSFGNVPSIVREGLEINGGHSTPPHSDSYGEGIHLSPYVRTAVAYSPTFAVQHKCYDILFFVRVRPGWFDVDDDGDLWLVRDEKDVRLVAILFKEDLSTWDWWFCR